MFIAHPLTPFCLGLNFWHRECSVCQDASLALNTADRELKNAEALSKKQMLSQREVNEAIGAHEGAKLRVQRAETLLNLYRKADPKNEAASESSTPNGGAPPAKAANRSREL